MASCRIVCVTLEQPHGHAVEVGNGERPELPYRRWTIGELRLALAASDSCYTISPSTGRRAGVELSACPVAGCPAQTIRSSAEATHDNVLEALPECRWR